MIKHYQYKDGRTECTFSDINHYSDDEDWCSISVGHYSDGTRYIKATYDPIDTINGYEVVTAKWLRKYIWNSDGAQVVHTINNETINGTKTFTNSIISNSSTLIKSGNWSNIGVADTSRETSSQKIIGSVEDKDGKRFIALEVSANTDGGRTLHINGRNRSDTWWTTLAKFTENGDGSFSASIGGSPAMESEDTSLVTSNWVKQWLKKYVSISDNQEINGEKTFNSSVLCKSNYSSNSTRAYQVHIDAFDEEIAPSTDIQIWPLQLNDKNGKSTLSVKYTKRSSGQSFSQLMCMTYEDGEAKYATLDVGFSVDGIAYATAPSPVTDSHFALPNSAVFSSTRRA